jgi:penicillin-binding protein 1A
MASRPTEGPHSVYAGGLWVRTSLDTQMQTCGAARAARGLLRFRAGRAWYGPIATIDPDKGDLTEQLASSNIGINYQDWRVGVVTARSGDSATIGFADGTEAPLVGLPDAIKVGDVTAAAPSGVAWAVRTVPEVQGGFLAEDPNTGRVLAMQGGFDNRLSDFNRATQAQRQPGSTIKPFVYATGLDQGMTPATMVPDQTFCVYQGANLGEKCFRNFGGEGGGEHTMRWGLEQSRNLMTVHIASDAGMENVTQTFQRVGIGKYGKLPVVRARRGRDHGAEDGQRLCLAGQQRAAAHPDADRLRPGPHGKVIWRADERECTGCNMDQWDGKPMPRLRERGPHGARSAHSLPGDAHARGRDPARHRDRAARSRHAAVRQDRDHQRADRRVVRRRLARHRRRGLPRLRPPAQPRRVGPGRARRGADLQAVRAGNTCEVGRAARSSLRRACAWCASTGAAATACSMAGRPTTRRRR